MKSDWKGQHCRALRGWGDCSGGLLCPLVMCLLRVLLLLPEELCPPLQLSLYSEHLLLKSGSSLPSVCATKPFAATLESGVKALPAAQLKPRTPGTVPCFPGAPAIPEKHLLFQVGQLRHREVKGVAQGPTAKPNESPAHSSARPPTAPGHTASADLRALPLLCPCTGWEGSQG